MVPVLVAAAVSAVIAFAALRGSEWHQSLIGWGSESIAAIVQELVSWIASYAIGEGFVGGWVLLPTVAAAVALLGVMVYRAAQGHGWWPIVVLLALLATPFSLGLALGGEQMNRTMQVLPWVAGSVWLLLALALPARRALVGVLLAAGVLLTVWHSSVTGRLFWTEHTTYENDRIIAAAIVERLAADGWDGEQVPIVSVGRRPVTPIEDHADDENIGMSLFNSGGGVRTAPFMITLGYPLWFATAEERALAHDHAQMMPSWPAGGSVVLHEGVAIVKFSDDYDFTAESRW